MYPKHFMDQRPRLRPFAGREIDLASNRHPNTGIGLDRLNGFARIEAQSSSVEPNHVEPRIREVEPARLHTAEHV